MGAVPGWFARIFSRAGTYGSHLTYQASVDYIGYDLMVVPSPIPLLDKSSVRTELKAQRRAFAASLSAEERAALEAALTRLLEPLLEAAAVVAAYHPTGDEISPLPALVHARALGRTIALPSFAARDALMTFRFGEASESGPWSIPQPSAEAPAVTPDLILVPLVGCDPVGHRLGMGKGHYDRALAGLRGKARLVGLGWDFQLLEQPLASDPWDQPLDAFASPAGLTEFPRA